MISSQDCSDKAAACETHAQACEGTPLAADWREMARQWRLLAADGDASETLARLMRRTQPPTQP